MAESSMYFNPDDAKTMRLLCRTARFSIYSEKAEIKSA